ncbi:hypothetical protein [Sorangium sp. So ce426]|uniref:hypothetical protein n=1 Tax=Sorangium sp. So ce426 TaxID=3133312 RepID=UPI003F5B8A4D
MAIGQELLNVPFGEMVTSLGQAIAQAQLQLDTTSMKIAQIMAGQPYDVPNATGDGTHSERLLVEFGGQQLSMLELGFTPSFYHFVDTIIEVKISITISNEISSSLSTFRGSFNSYFALFAAGASCSSVSASYANKYNYSAEGSSLIRTKIQPVPTPAIFEQRIRALLAAG